MTGVQTGDRVSRYSVDVACRVCGPGTLTHRATGSTGSDARAVARCVSCGRHWGVVVEMVDVSADITHVRERVA